MLQPNALAARLDAALVVAGAWPAEARLEQIVRRERLEARGQLALRTDENLGHRRPQIVIREAMRHRAEVGERAHVPVEKAHLVLPVVDAREVAARVHQPHHEHPPLAPLARDVDEHLEEVHFGEVAGVIHERHEHLAPSALPLGDGLTHRRDPDAPALGEQHLVQPRRRQPLLASGPPRRLREQRFDARADHVQHRTAARSTRPVRRLGALDVAPHGIARDAELARHPPHRQPFDQHLMPHHVYLIHPQHPLAEPRHRRPSNFRGLDRWVDQFSSGVWITFRPARSLPLKSPAQPHFPGTAHRAVRVRSFWSTDAGPCARKSVAR